MCHGQIHEATYQKNEFKNVNNQPKPRRTTLEKRHRYFQ